MKVKIVTMNSAYNYGAMLQAYALQETIKSMGHDCSFIDQRDTDKKKVVYSKGLSNLPKNILSWVYKNQVEQGYRRFENFITDEQKLTEENYSNYNNLFKYPPKADVFITGSDQVWNPISFKPINFLDFVGDDAKKVSYAASMGVSFIPDEKKDKFKEYINKFDYISVREENTKGLIEDLTDKEVNVNVDPVFLLNNREWMKLAEPVEEIKKPYILAYVMYRTKFLNQWLKKVHKETGLDIILIYNTSYRNVFKNKMIRNAGPKEFIWLMANAEKIVTSSFHGTAFAAIFNKPFYTIINPDSPARITNIINKLDMHDTILESNSSLVFPEINYEKVNSNIEKEKEKSLDYLNKALSIKE